MKKILLVVVLVLCMAGVANATPYSNTVDWNDITNYLWTGRDAKLIDDSNVLGTGGNLDPYPFTWTHNVSFVPPAASIDSAVITLSHMGNNPNAWIAKDVWLLTDSGNTLLGALATSNVLTGWIDQDFTLDPSYYSAISGGSWLLGIRLTEGTGGWDTIALDRSVLHGEYTAVPEPATMLLFGLGLLGVAGIRRFKK